jgi:protein SCO1/2
MIKRPLKIGILVIVAFAAGLLLARVLAPSRAAPPQMERATLLPQARPLPALELVDQDGDRLPRDFFSGRWTLVFFGFTQCPDVCPTTLATLARAKQQLQDLAPDDQPRVLLVSVDPERDTPERLAAYVHFFDPAFLAATGTPEAVADAASAFGVPYARVDLPDGGYTMDHGSGIFVVGPEGGIDAFLSAPHDARIIAHDYRALVAWKGHRS